MKQKLKLLLLLLIAISFLLVTIASARADSVYSSNSESSLYSNYIDSESTSEQDSMSTFLSWSANEREGYTYSNKGKRANSFYTNLGSKETLNTYHKTYSDGAYFQSRGVIYSLSEKAYDVYNRYYPKASFMTYSFSSYSSSYRGSPASISDFGNNKPVKGSTSSWLNLPADPVYNR